MKTLSQLAVEGSAERRTGRLHSHDPWKGRGALGWGSSSIWHHPVLTPPPPETPTSALHVRPHRRPEGRSFSPHRQRLWYSELAIAESRQGARLGLWHARKMVLFAVHMEPFSTQFLKGSHGPGDGPAALTRPMERSGGPWLGLRVHLAPPGSDAPPTGDTHLGPPRPPTPTAGGPETGRLHSHDPWKGRGALGWGSGRIWHHPVLTPLPPETLTSALHNWPSRRLEGNPFGPHLQPQWYCELVIVEPRQEWEL